VSVSVSGTEVSVVSVECQQPRGRRGAGPGLALAPAMSRPKVLALILAGGKGSRLGPLTASRAKPALPFAGVYHLIDFPLSNCVHSGLADVWVVEQFQPHELNDHLLNGRPWDLDRNTGGLRILPPFTGHAQENGEGGWSEGNADAIYRNRKFLIEFAADVLVVLSADHVYTLDLRDVIDRHLATGAAVTMVTTEVPVESASRFGVVQVGEGDRVTGFAYKPEHPEGGTVTTEVFVYDAPALLETLERLAAEQGDGDTEDEDDGARLEDFGDLLLPALVDAGRAHAYPLGGYWRDVGTVDSYWEGHMDLLAPDRVLRPDDPAWPILSVAAHRMPARIHATARIDASLVSPGCLVAGEVTRSVLGPGVVVERGASVRDAVLLGNVTVRRGARVSHAIVDDEVEIGENAHVGHTGEPGDERPAITVVGRRAHVAAGARVAPGEQVDADVAPRVRDARRGTLER
jgi:glucose-1-phosphate adenylyltransferase